MPRYFFNLRRGPGIDKLSVDPEGELALLEELRGLTLGKIRRIMTVRSDIVRNWLDCAFEITDAQGAAILTVPFIDVVEDHSQ